MTGQGNWTWLLTGRVPTLIDAGVGEPGHLEAIESALGGVELAQVLVTHGHPDHAAGVPSLATRWPHARFLKMPWPERDVRWPARWEPIADGDTLAAGDTSLVAVHTPGHAPDHLCFWHEDMRHVFCGDLAQKGTTIFIPADRGGDLAAYIASLERILALDPVRLYPAHGAIIEDPASVIRHYIEHRHEREAQILDALRRGDTGAEDVVARLYRGLPEALIVRARDTVTAHLRKLERDGRVARTDDGWHIIGP